MPEPSAQHPGCSFNPDCTAMAVSSYTWPWGEHGTCCAAHEVEIRQRGEALQRTPSITSLAASMPQPITLEERQGWHARLLALEEELGACRERGLGLYQQNQAQATEGARFAARCAELEAQLAGAKKALADAQAANGALRQQAAQATERVQQLQALLPRQEQPKA
jgi:hypothetical protein